MLVFNILSVFPFLFLSFHWWLLFDFPLQNDHLMHTRGFVVWALLNAKWTEVSRWFYIPSFCQCEENRLSVTSKTWEGSTGTKSLNAGHWEVFRRAAKGHSSNAWKLASAKCQSKAFTAVPPFCFSQENRMGFKEGSTRATWHPAAGGVITWCQPPSGSATWSDSFLGISENPFEWKVL